MEPISGRNESGRSTADDAPEQPAHALHILGSRAWPDIALDREAFAAFVAPHLRGQQVGALEAGDLFLACACLGGVAGAAEAFDREYRGDMIKSLSRFHFSAAERDDIVQTLRVAFMVKGKLASYSGRGKLRAWVRSASLRAGLDHQDSKKPQARGSDESLLDGLPATGNAELDLARARFKNEFKSAFESAVAALAADDRRLLAQHYVDGLTIDQLCVVERVHRATVARRIARLREQLFEMTNERLRAQLQMSAPELESMMRLVRSQLDISIHRMLRA